MRRITLILILAVLLVQSGFAASAQLDAYKARHDARIVGEPVYSSEHAGFAGFKQNVSLSPAFGDLMIGSDSEPERFRQQYPDVAVFPDSDYAVVWEDDRNGDFDVYVQLFAPDDTPFGSNVKIQSDHPFSDQRMPSCDTDDDGDIAIAWIDGDGGVYIRVFDQSLAAVTDIIKVNDDVGGNVCNLPSVAYLHGGSIGVVWEDSRAGENIYCQLYTPAYEPTGSNFQINTTIPGSSYWFPRIASGASSGFAVSWDYVSSVGSSVLMKTFTTGGTALSGLISLPDPESGLCDRFQTSVTHIIGMGYLACWVDTRDTAQAVYAQILDYDGNKNGSNISICDNADYVCWDVASALSADSSLFVTWSSYGERAEILGTRLTAAGDRDGSNITISDSGLFTDRFGPNVAFGNSDMPVVVFTDLREGDHDVYMQKLDSSGGLVGANSPIPSVETGAHQTSADLALLNTDIFAAVWCDERNDEGDIYIQFGNTAGSLSGSNMKVNQDSGPYLQVNPAVGGASNGYAVVAWQDARGGDGITGINIFARRYNSSGSPLGDELMMNDDISSALKAEPDAAQASTGKSIVVWRDKRNGQNDIFGQKITLGGSMDGANFRINSDPMLTDNRAPKVGMTSGNDAVIAWRSISDGISQVYFQLYGADGAPVGSNVSVDSDRSTDSQIDFDLAVDPESGEFIVAWINETDSSTYSVIAQRYDNLGIAAGSSLLLSNLPAAGGDDISAAIDASGNYTVCWTDSRSGSRRVYMTIVKSDDFVEEVIVIPDPGVDARSEHGAVAMTGNEVLTVWSDNRNEGDGYDIYANSHAYTSTPADEIDDDLLRPSSFAVSQNYPNPFNPATTIRFCMPKAGDATIEVINSIGQIVLTESMNELSPGWHEYVYTASDQPSGVYFYRVRTDEHTASRKMVLVK